MIICICSKLTNIDIIISNCNLCILLNVGDETEVEHDLHPPLNRQSHSRFAFLKTYLGPIHHQVDEREEPHYLVIRIGFNFFSTQHLPFFFLNLYRSCSTTKTTELDLCFVRSRFS